MAKRPAEDEEDEIPKIRKRRRPQKKADDDDEGGAPNTGAKRKAADDEDDEDGEGSISTGNVILDIVLDFRDDCIEWAQEHFLYALIIAIVSFLIFAILSFLFIHSWTRYLNRPSLIDVANTYELGAFPETKFLADYALDYVPASNPETRCAFLFFQGAATCALAERALPAEQHDYYLTAANYLKESARYGFLPSRISEGWFLLGKCLFHCNELVQCRKPLEIALDEKSPHTKEIFWYLANAYYFGSSPDLQRSIQWLKRFQTEPTALEEEIAQSYLLEAMIRLQTDSIEAAEESFDKVPHFDQFTMMRKLVEGEIEFYKARRIRQQATDIENDPNPVSLPELPVAPAPVSPTDIPLGQIRSQDYPAPAIGTFDGDSELQQRIAVMRVKFADETNPAGDNVTNSNPPIDEADRVIVLPKEEAKPAAPQPPTPPKKIHYDPIDNDPVLKRAKEFRDLANDHYRLAIAHFAEVIRLSAYEPQWGRIARLLTGISYSEMNEPKNASIAFHNLIETYPVSHESAAANFMVGEYERSMGHNDLAFRAFAQAFDNMRRDSNYVSFFLPKSEILDRCTDMIRRDIAAQTHADAVKLLDAVRGVMPQPAIARLKGETYENWAEMLQQQAETTFGDKGNQLVKDAESKRRSAGEAFEELAELLSDTQDFSNILWRSGEDYRLGKDYRRGIISYKKFIKANVLDRRPEVNLYLGEMYLHLDFLDEAVHVLEEALHDHPADVLVPLIRLVLSHTYYEKKEWDKAKALLQLNLIGEFTPASAPYRDSMYALGKISYEQGNLEEAIPYLEDAIKVHPEAVQAADAHYTLAKAYLGRADEQLKELGGNPPEAVRQLIDTAVLRDRQRGLSHLERTIELLADRQRAIGLTEAEKLMYRNAQFSTGSLLMKMEQYDRAIPLLNTLATMYQDRAESLEALVSLAVALRTVGRETESQTTLKRAEVILTQLEKSGKITDGTNWRNIIQNQRKK